MNLKTAFVLFLLILGGIGWLSERPQSQVITASMIYVIDGDTIDIDGERYRLVGFDTPETYRAECESEKQLGEQATWRLRALIAGANEITLEAQPNHDKYGRGLGTLRIEGRDVGDVLISEGLARPFRSGSRQPWC